MTTTATALRITAAISSITSAAAAYPVAASMFGMLAGGVIVTSSAAVIYAGWHYVGTETATDQLSISKRVGAGLAASVFAIGMVAGIYTSASQVTASTTQTAAQAADELYIQQEASRIKTLSSLTQELSLTNKKNNPTEYARLEEQVSKLSEPTARTLTATEKVSIEIPAAYKWGIAATFEVVTPALLLLAGLFSRRRQPVNTVNSVNNSSTTVTTAVNSDDDSTFDILTHLLDRQITPTRDGLITAAVVSNQTGCTDRQARTAIQDAYHAGALTKEGNGNASRYRYQPINQLRIVK